MAHVITPAVAFVQLTINTDTGLAVDDYITAPSGAGGIIAEITNATTIQVYEMTAQAFVPTEVITASGSSATANATATAAGSTTLLPTDAVMVEGTDSTVINIYRAIANAATGGVSNPSSTQACLGLEMTVYVGKDGQTADTYALSYDENVRLGYSSAKSQVRLVGSSTNSTSLQHGFHKYTDNDKDNYPPAYMERGSTIDVRCVNRAGIGFNVDIYSFCYWNASTYKGDGALNGSNYDNAGETRFTGTRLLNFTGFVSNAFGAKMYVKDLYAQELIQSVFYLPGVLTYSDGIYQSNSAACNTFFSFGFSWEATAFNVISHDSNGELGTDSLLATGFSDNVMHCVNSEVDVTKFTSIFIGRGTSLKEISFKLTVQDELGNLLEGASVNVENQHAKALFRITDVIADTNPIISASQTTIPFDSAHGLSVGDSFRLSSEEMTVLTVPTTTTVTVTRGANGTVGIIHANHGAAATGGTNHQALAIAEKGTTDSDGVIEYGSSGNGKNAIVLETASFANNSTIVTGSHVTYTDFVITVSKSGYKTIKEPITIAGETAIDCPITLIANRYIEQKSR